MLKAALNTIILCLSLGSASAFADSLPERIDTFVDLFEKSDSIVVYDIRNLQSDYPTRLLTPESMLPQTAAYPLRDVQRLYDLSKNVQESYHLVLW